jgi:glycosyltransferase involved in cell wall biosynthesis
MEWEMSLHDRVNGYIPIWYEYAEPFRNHPKTLKTIRIPINAAKFEYTPNIVKDKIVFFHGRPSRPGAKGTAYIEEAFKRMKNRYGDIAEFHVAGGLPFKEYMSLVARTNVILDDTNSYSIAMNGLFSLAQGKIVLGGAEREGNEELGLMDNPVINIVPDVNQICEAIEFLIKNKDTFVELGKKGREFVERNHDFKEIARLYVNTIENN